MNKKKLLILSVYCSLTTFLTAQTTVTFQPNASIGKDAFVHGTPSYTDDNFGSNSQFPASAWTFSGNPGVVRSLIDFTELSTLPANATLISAQLSLYAIDFSNGLGQHSQLSGSNATWIERVTTSWDESTVNWDNQPATTTQNQVALAGTSTTTQNYLNIDITALIQDIMDNPGSSYGLMLKLQDESYYRRMNFCSSDHTNQNLRPKLVITYSTDCAIFQPDATTGKDAFVHGTGPYMNNNFGSNNQFPASAWTFNGDPGVLRSLIDFTELSTLPDNITIQSAQLSLYAIDYTNGLGQHSQLSGSNDAWLERITSNWDESTVTWNNQPVTTVQNRVYLTGTNNATQNYLDIDVTDLVQDMLDDPTNSFGFMLKLQDENYYRRLNFCSSDHSTGSFRPMLEVCYSIDTVPPCTQPDLAQISGPTSFCEGGSSTLSVTSGNLNDAANWQWYSGACGSNPIGTGALITVTESGTYFVRGEGGCVSNGNCASFTVTEIIVNSGVQNVDQNLVGTGGTAYQWLDCENNLAPVAGETSSAFTPELSGSFAVIAYANGCSDTSECIPFIVEQTTDSCLVMQPDASVGKDAFVHGTDSYMTVNFGTNNQFPMSAWTFGGVPGVLRSLIDFTELSIIPENSVIESAELSLYAIDYTNGLGQHSQLSGSNDFWIERITSDWNETTVNWNNQPNTTAQNRVSISGTTNPTQNYLNIDVTQLVQDMINDPAGSFGFMFMLQNENYYRRMNFCSSDHITPTLRPTLVVCVSEGSTAGINSTTKSETLNCYPNPTSDELSVSIPKSFIGQNYKLTDELGRVVLEGTFSNEITLLHLATLSSGVYSIIVPSLSKSIRVLKH